VATNPDQSQPEAGTAPAAGALVDDADMLKQFYTGNGFSPGGVDILCVGPGAKRRIAILIQMMLTVHDGEGRLAIPRIVVVVSPTREAESYEDALFNAFAAHVKESRGTELSEEERGVVRRRVSVVQASNANLAAAITVIDAAPKAHAVIIESAAHYRGADVSPFVPPGSEKPTLQEDHWAPHLHALALAAKAAAERASCIVVLEAGEPTPTRQALVDLLQSIDGVGMIGGSRPGDPMTVISARVDEWIAKLNDGRIGVVLKEVDALQELDEDNKTHLKIQMLHTAKLTNLAVDLISAQKRAVNEIDGQAVVKLAHIAVEGGAFALARRLLASAVDRLATREELELGLAAADRSGATAEEAGISARFRALYPDAPALFAYDVQDRLSRRDYGGAAALIAGRPGEEENTEFYQGLGAAFAPADVPDYASIVARWSARGGDWGGRASIACIKDALARRLPPHALMLALAFAQTNFNKSTGARLLNDAIELALLMRGPNDTLAAPRDDLIASLHAVVAYLAANPGDGAVRVGLQQALSPENSGIFGQVFAVTLLLQLAQTPVSLLPSPPRGKADAEWLMDRKEFLHGAFTWASAESPLIIGRAKMPKALITENADDLAASIAEVVELMGNHDDDPQTLLHWTAIGAAVAPHCSDPTQVIPLVRLAASKLATIGQRQHSRDLAEQVMLAAERLGAARQAWFAMADIYHRAGNPLESLLAMCCALASGSEADKEQMWHETTTIVRLLRDHNMREQALDIIERARGQFERLGLVKTNGHRLDLLEVQVRYGDIKHDADAVRDQGPDLLSRCLDIARATVRLRDDPAPVGAMLAQIARRLIDLGMAVTQDTTAVLDDLIARASPANATLMRMLMAPAPTASDIAALLVATQPARYSEDAGYDVQRVAMAAGGLLGSAEANDASVAALAIESMCDRAIATPGWEAVAAPPQSLNSVDEVTQAAKFVAAQGLDVVLAGFDNNGGLSRVRVNAAGAMDVERLPDITLDRLRAWTDQQLPYRYGVSERNPNLFFTSTEGMNLGALNPTRTLIVADPRLQRFPPHLFREDNTFIGATRPLAAAPSLAWLKAAQASPLRGTGARAWISTADGGGQTLAWVADYSTPILEAHGVALDTSASLPAALAGSQLAIIAAHGQVVPDGQYFQIVADEGDFAVSAAEFAQGLRNVGVVVLFVCSAGRADTHPTSNTTVGLAKQLLDRGCSAVIASPWPLRAVVPAIWLPKFLESWDKNDPVIDCVYEANRAVAQSGSGPADALALSLYGNPFVRRAT